MIGSPRESCTGVGVGVSIEGEPPTQPGGTKIKE